MRPLRCRHPDWCQRIGAAFQVAIRQAQVARPVLGEGQVGDGERLGGPIERLLFLQLDALGAAGAGEVNAVGEDLVDQRAGDGRFVEAQQRQGEDDGGRPVAARDGSKRRLGSA